MALMKLSVAGEGALIVRHVGLGAAALSVTQSELAPASSRFGLLGSRMKGAMKFAFFVALIGHRAEFHQAKDFSVQAGTLLAEENW